MNQTLSESVSFCKRYDKNTLVCFSIHSVKARETVADNDDLWSAALEMSMHQQQQP